MQKSVLNKQGKFAVKILWRYTDMAIFVLRCFILTHPVLRNFKLAKSKRVADSDLATNYTS